MDGRRPNNEFIENGLENWVLVNRTNLRMGSNRKVMKRKGFVVKKIVIGRIRGGLFLYIALKFGYKFSSRMLQCFFLSYSITFLVLFPSFYTASPFDPYLPRACQIVDVDTCPTNTSCKSSCSSCKAENILFRYHFHINAARELAVGVYRKPTDPSSWVDF